MIHTNDPHLRCLFYSGGMSQCLCCSCSPSAINARLVLLYSSMWDSHGLIIYTCCHATLCFTVSECWDSEQWQGLRAPEDHGIPECHWAYRDTHTPGQSGLEDSPPLPLNTSLSSFIKTIAFICHLGVEVSRPSLVEGCRSAAQIMNNCIRFTHKVPHVAFVSVFSFGVWLL